MKPAESNVFRNSDGRRLPWGAWAPANKASPWHFARLPYTPSVPRGREVSVPVEASVDVEKGPCITDGILLSAGGIYLNPAVVLVRELAEVGTSGSSGTL